MGGSAETFGPAAFVSALYGDALAEDRRAVVWAKGNGAVWCKNAAEVEAVATSRGQTHDVYLGACLQDAAAERAGARGEASTVVCLPGVWADVDVQDAGHKSGLYPPTAEAALAQLAARIPQPPTLVVATGGGLHAWWLLDEPWLLESDADRAEAAVLVLRFQARIRLAWAEHGWRLDPTHDLARVMRLPGTWNRKREPARPVTLLEQREARHAPSDLLDGCPQAPSLAPATEPASSNGLVIDGSRSPPAEKLMALCEVDGKFKLTWLRKRGDLSDQSQSGYDYALIVRSLRAGWSDQEIVDLCVAHRRQGGDGPKRLDYYTSSLGRAKVSAKQAEAETERSATVAASLAAQTEATERLLDLAAGAPEVTLDARARVLADLREALGLPVAGFKRHLLDPPVWDMILDDQRVIRLGSREWGTKHSVFREKVMDVLAFLPPALKASKWEPIVNLMLQLAEDVEYPELVEENGLIEGFVRDYVRASRPSDDTGLAATKGLPMIRNGRLALYLSHFRGWLDRAEGERLTRGKLATMMRRAGWTTCIANYESGGRRSTRLYWLGTADWPWPIIGNHSPKAEKKPLGPNGKSDS